MNNEQFMYLNQIYNTLSLINTKGEDTITMASCLTAMQELIKSIEVKEGKEDDEQ